MECKDIKKNLESYIDSELLSDEVRKKIHVHLDSCEECRREYEEMKFIKEELEKLSDVELPKDFHKNLMSRIKKSQVKNKENFFKRHYKWGTAIAAVLLIGVVSTVGIGLLPRIGLFDSFAPKAMNEIAVEQGMATTDNVRSSEAKFMSDEQVESFGEQNYPAPEESLVASDAVERKIIKTVYMELDTDDIELTFNGIHQHVSGIGGYIEYSNIGDTVYSYYDKTQMQEEMRYASINARVPADMLDSALEYVDNLGDVKSKSLNTTDQSDYYYDIDSQVENLEVREERLRELMDKATDISDILEIERELSRVRIEIDSLTRNMKYIDKNVDYSTLNIQLREVITSSKINPEERNIFTEAKEGLIKNINKLLNFMQDSFVWVISYLPVLIVGVIGLSLLYLIIKKIGILSLRKKLK